MTRRKPPGRPPQGVIEHFDALISDVWRARERGVDIGLREFDRVARENALAAWRHHRAYHYLGPRNGDDMPESAHAWHGDPAIPHQPTTERGERGFHPACSCGFRALLTSDTEAGALRRARVHAQVSVPRPEGRYTLSAYDGQYGTDKVEVKLRCRDCRDQRALLQFDGLPDEHRQEIAAVVREHESKFHGSAQ